MIRCLLPFLAAALLGACANTAGLDTRAPPPDPSCCTSFAELPYQTMDLRRPTPWTIGKDSPALGFDDGPSRVAAFRLPAARPLSIEVTSGQTAGPGYWGRQLTSDLGLQALSPVRLLHPVVLLLDEQFQIVRSLQPAGVGRVPCDKDLPDAAKVRLQFDVEDVAPRAAYLVVRTSDTLQRNGMDQVCNATVVYGPTGQLELRVDDLDFHDGRIALASGAIWFPQERAITSWTTWRHWLKAMDFREEDPPGRLLLGQSRLKYFDRTGSGMRPRLDIPVDTIVAASTSGRDISLAVAATADAAATWHSFRLSRAQGSTSAELMAALQPLLRTDVALESLDFSTVSWPDKVDVSTADGKNGGRVGDAAITAGMVAAMPCGLCQTGACGPELLAPCAAAFAVGAVLGGAWAVVKEMSGANPPVSSAPNAAELASAQHAAAAPVAAEAKRTFSADALNDCVRQAFAAQPDTAWRDRGWTALLPGNSSETVGRVTSRRRLELSVTGIALASNTPAVAGAAPAERPMQLVIDGLVRLRAADGTNADQQPVSWTSTSRTLGQWGVADSADLHALLDGACQSLARQVLQAGETMWRKH
jgi:hypothetical protein